MVKTTQINNKKYIGSNSISQMVFKYDATPRRTFRNIVGHVEGVSDVTKLSAWVSEQFDPKLSWEDVSRIRDWCGVLLLKVYLNLKML